MSSVKTAKARSTGASTTIDVVTEVAWVSVIGVLLLCVLVSLFDSLFERVQGRVPEAVEVVAKAGQAGRVEAVDPAIPYGHVVYQARFLQHLEVLGHGRPADREQRGEIHDGGGAHDEVLQNGPACRVGKGDQGRIVSCHLQYVLT